MKSPPDDGDPRKCFCWDLRLPHVHTLDDHEALRQTERDKITRNQARLRASTRKEYMK